MAKNLPPRTRYTIKNVAANADIFLRFSMQVDTNKQPLTDFAGAQATCWIRAESQEVAERRARVVLIDLGWLLESLEDGYIITADWYSEDTEGLEHYEQAQIDGETYVIYPWCTREE
jgi:hypothetical protein